MSDQDWESSFCTSVLGITLQVLLFNSARKIRIVSGGLGIGTR
jgi:hypothetical protein